jgi:hypothetical protein
MKSPPTAPENIDLTGLVASFAKPAASGDLRAPVEATGLDDRLPVHDRAYAIHLLQGLRDVSIPDTPCPGRRQAPMIARWGTLCPTG